MSTSPSSLEAALAKVPAQFRTRAIDRYGKLKSAYADRQFDACGLRAGRLAEVLLRYLQHELTGRHIAFGVKQLNMTDECSKLERLPEGSGHESYRVLIPRALNLVYTLRNKRDFGHEGGDIDANEIDAATAVRLMDWCISEIIRVTLAVPLEDAQKLLDAIAERQISLVWGVPGGPKRVLDPSLKMSEKTLILLYSDLETAVPIEDLAAGVGTNRLDTFKSRVLNPLHDRVLIHFDSTTRTVMISPTGSEAAEAILHRLGKV